MKATAAHLQRFLGHLPSGACSATTLDASDWHSGPSSNWSSAGGAIRQSFIASPGSVPHWGEGESDSHASRHVMLAFEIWSHFLVEIELPEILFPSSFPEAPHKLRDQALKVFTQCFTCIFRHHRLVEMDSDVNSLVLLPLSLLWLALLWH